MKEIKYISHISRNFFLYFLLFFTYSLISNLHLSSYRLFFGLITFIIGYTPVYFLNDLADQTEDLKHNKANLYSKISNKYIFWSTVSALMILGLIFSYILNTESLVVLFTLYLLNYLYSFSPAKLRNKKLLREATIFIIYMTKWILILQYWGFSVSYLSWPITIMSSAMAALSVSIYKRHINISHISEAIFGLTFLLSWGWIIIYFPMLRLLFLPLLPAIIYLSFKYKKTQIPIGMYQTAYFIYSLTVYLILSKI